MFATVAVKVALSALDGTVTEGGTLTDALLLASDTTTLPEAACVSVAVHEAVPPELTVVGLHETLLRLGATPSEMLPPVPLAGILPPFASTAETFVTPTLTVPEAAPESVTFTTATVPLAMVF